MGLLRLAEGSLQRSATSGGEGRNPLCQTVDHLESEITNEGETFFLPSVRKILTKVRPRIERHEVRGMLDPTTE